MGTSNLVSSSGSEGPPSEISESVVRHELDAVLASGFFRDAELLKRLLRYAVEQTLFGRARELKEYRVGLEVFGRDGSFDPRLDPVVRMAARRLRAKLSEYYASEGQRAELRIEIPKGGYAARFSAAPVRIRVEPLAAPIRWVAVLPFQNLSGDPAQEYLADGITETLITDLAQIRALRVISRTSAWTYKGTTKNLPQIARELSVDAVVEGSMMRSGDRIRICAQLIDAASDTHLWAQGYDVDVLDLLSLQSGVAQAIVHEVGVKLTPQERLRIGTVRLTDPAAHDAYLLGRYHWNKRTAESIDKAIELFEKASRIDPNAAEAYVGLASAYVPLLAADSAPGFELAPKARSAAEKAIALDGALAEPHAALGVVRAVADHDWSGCDAAFKNAFERDCNNATAHHWYGYMLMYRGRTAEASHELQIAARLDPLNPTIMVAVAGPLNYAGRYDEALQQVCKQLELDPRSFYALWGMGEVYLNMRRFGDAASAYREALAASPRSPFNVAKLCYALARDGRRDDALELLRELEEPGAGMYVSSGAKAIAYAGLGDKTRVLTALEQAYENRSFAMLILREQYFDSLRGEPRFQAIARATGLF
jgi:TolB-like protein/Flp pilus assembly protein TadD